MLLVFLKVFFIILPSTLFLLDHWNKKNCFTCKGKGNDWYKIGIKEEKFTNMKPYSSCLILYYSHCNLLWPNCIVTQCCWASHNSIWVSPQPNLHIPTWQQLAFDHSNLTCILVQKLQLHHNHLWLDVLLHLKHESGCHNYT